MHFVNRESTVSCENGMIGTMMIIIILTIVKMIVITERTIMIIKAMIIVLNNDKTDSNSNDNIYCDNYNLSSNQ